MQNIELAYLAVAYGTAGIMFYVSRHHSYPTISHIALHKKSTRQVFFWGLFVASILFAILMYGWAIPHFSFGLSIKVLVDIIVATVILVGYFPVTSKRFKSTHLVFVSVLGVSMIIFVVTLACTSNLHYIARIANGIVAVGMLVTCATAIRVRNEQYLSREKIFFTLWHLAIFVTIYFG